MRNLFNLNSTQIHYDSRQIRTNALALLWLIVILYPAWYWVCVGIEPAAFESLSERLLASLPAAVGIILLNKYPKMHRYSEYFLIVAATSVMWHIFRLVTANNMTMIFVSGGYLAFFAMSLGFSTVRATSIYCGLVVLGGGMLFFTQPLAGVLSVNAVLLTFTFIILVVVSVKGRLQAQVFQSEQRLLQVLENLPVSIMFRHGRDLFANALFAQIFGDRSRPTLEKRWTELKALSYVQTDGPVKVTLESGQVKQLHLKLSLVGGLEIMTILDETLRVEAQANMLFASKMASLGEMAGSVAHEINNPLAIIRANAEFLLHKADENDRTDSALVHNHSDKIIKTTERIAQIIIGLRKISHQGDPAVLDRHPIGDVFADTLAFCEARIKSRGITLVADKTNRHLVFCNSTATVQILVNLLNNAVDALESADHPTIKISAETTGDTCQIFVDDNGTGIDPAIYDKIMLPFFTTKEIGKGTGLGLSISKSLAEKQGGDLTHIPQSKGAKFCLRLRAETPSTSL